MQTVELGTKSRGLRQMLALLKTAAGGYDLYAVEEEPLDLFGRLMVCHYNMPSEIRSGECRRASLIRRKFRREAVVDCARYIASAVAAVGQYRQMVLSAIEAADAKREAIECFSMETSWADYFLVTELQKAAGFPVYFTNDGADICESKTARQAFLAHRRFEDRCLLII